MNSFFLLCLTTLLVVQPGDDARQNRRMKNRVERRELQNSIEEVTYHDRRHKVATVRIYDKANRQRSEELYSDYQQRIRHGRTRSWYQNGQLHWTCDFKENQINGPFFSYYEDGSLKRREYYRMGTVRKGECFLQDGTSVACQPLVQSVEFEGGQKKFVQFLQQRLGHIQSADPAFFITLEATVSEEGILYSLRPLAYLENRPESERQLAKQLIAGLRDMPLWKPMIVDDQPVQTDLLISIHINAGKVFNASYGLNLM
ncbi:hypothetical protein GCM10028803_19520 [Larkinella knui]|uniref:Uncharacterized protein n=1 Tax=Larkinella knui TaxID=2025310 RepID=A0A3P1CUM9_9BACT|nr:hypothetical protein [Larkinella knui]RRB17047.1 hypothetical protein EHT87_01825 [Larkinella knui]